MTIKRVLLWLLALTMVASFSPMLNAQHYQPFGPIDYTPVFQPFAPINDFLLDTDPAPNEGYFFSYERLHWSVQKPDRSPLGYDGAVSNASRIGTTNLIADPDQNTITALTVGGVLDVANFNSIESAVPSSEWGWGNRFNLGYIVDDEGWQLSIIAKLKQHFEVSYGSDIQRLMGLQGAQGLPGVDGIPFDDPLADQIDPPPTSPGQAPVAPTAGINAIPQFDGYRQVSIAFYDPLGLLDGFVDENVDTFPDDLNFNGVYGNAGVDTDGDGVPDTPAPTDFGDAVPLATVFDLVTVRDRVNIDAVDLMKMKRLRPTHHGSIIDLYYGVGWMEVDSRFNVQALGGVLANSQWYTRALNRIVGPEVAFRYSNRRRRWNFYVEGRFLAGANFAAVNQNGFLGSMILQGQPDNPYGMGPTSFANKLNTDRFTPVGEVRVGTSFQLTKGVALQAGWTAMGAGEIIRASNTVIYQLPTMGIRNVDQDFFTQGVNFGVEINR